MKSATLYYAHDPMCSWCWAFQPAWQQLQQQLPEQVRVVRLLGGLAADSDVPMAEEMQQFLQQTWRRIEQQVPGTQFNFDFWDRCSPRRSTYPACRAVIAAANQGAGYDPTMTRAIQQAYYLNARNPSDMATLIELARELGLDSQQFETDLTSVQTQATLLSQIRRCREIGAQGYPSLILEPQLLQPAGPEQAKPRWLVPLDYNDPGSILQAIAQRLAG